MSLVLSGYYHWQKGKISSQNVFGLLWSSSLVKQGEDWVRVLMLGSDFINDETQEYFHGFSLRCKNSGPFPTGSSAARSYPVSLVLSGRYDWPNGQTKFQDGDGNWWGSNTQNQWNSYDLGVHQTLLDPERLHDNRYGFALRCVKRLYGSTSARSYPVSLVFSGIYSWIGGGYLDYQNEWAFIYTSATLIYNNKELGQDLLISTNVVNPGAGNDKRVGHALRWL